ncbi:hypothetical protein HYZ41_04145 [archaeon]|nr:hypothetical protein [archaeon]
MARANIGKAIGTAISCGASLKRMFPFFVVNLIYLVTIAAFFDAAATFLKDAASGEFVKIFAFLPNLAMVAIVFIIMFFVSLFLQAGLVDNARNYWNKKEVKFGKSLKTVRPMYISLVGASILVVVISLILNIVSLIGWLLSLVASWFFIVVTQSVILSKKNAVSALEDSYNVFMKNKWQTFAFWLVLVVLSVVFSVLAFVPVLLAALPALAAASTIGFIAAFKANFSLFIIGGIVSSFFLAFVTTFSESAKTFYYMQVKKR